SPLASVRKAAMASRSLRRWPTAPTPMSFRSSAVKRGRTVSSISLSRNAVAYRSRPRLRSHSVGSMVSRVYLLSVNMILCLGRLVPTLDQFWDMFSRIMLWDSSCSASLSFGEGLRSQKLDERTQRCRITQEWADVTSAPDRASPCSDDQSEQQ